MTQGSNGADGMEPELPPEDEARLFAALRSLGDARGGAEIDDATMLARVLAGASEAVSHGSAPAPVVGLVATSDGGAPAPVVSLEAASGLRGRKRPAFRRGVAAVFAGLAIAATVAYAAQRILSPSVPPPAPPEPPAPSSTAPGGHDAPRLTPAPSESATSTGEEPAAPSASAAPDEPAPLPSATQAQPAVPTADELLKRAQTLYTADDTAGAAAAYRSLIARYPASSEARAALISLGQLALRGGRADEALGLFDRYLAGGGPLAIEARVGRIGALRSLGRTADERAAIDDFLARHGDGVHAARLRARLAEISGP